MTSLGKSLISQNVCYYEEQFEKNLQQALFNGNNRTINICSSWKNDKRNMQILVPLKVNTQYENKKCYFSEIHEWGLVLMFFNSITSDHILDNFREWTQDKIR